jgi:hypothetical protein
MYLEAKRSHTNRTQVIKTTQQHPNTQKLKTKAKETIQPPNTNDIVTDKQGEGEHEHKLSPPSNKHPFPEPN